MAAGLLSLFPDLAAKNTFRIAGKDFRIAGKEDIATSYHFRSKNHIIFEAKTISFSKQNHIIFEAKSYHFRSNLVS